MDDATPTLRECAGDRLSAAELYRLLELRQRVFVVEQQCAYSDADGRDLLPGSRHLWFERDGRVLTQLRLLTEADGIRIGRVATAVEARGHGLAGRLLDRAVELIGDRPSVLDAQSHLVGWYAHWGYAGEGQPFDEDGIEHLTMRRPGRSDH